MMALIVLAPLVLTVPEPPLPAPRPKVTMAYDLKVGWSCGPTVPVTAGDALKNCRPNALLAWVAIGFP